MTPRVLLPELAADSDRSVGHRRLHEGADVGEQADEILSRLRRLLKHPQIVADGRRERVRGRGVRGFVARYRDEAALGGVCLLALRAQREAGWARE